LVGLVLDGHTDAFDVLVRKHQRRVVAIAYRLLSHSEDASDVAQDAFIRAYRRLGQLSDARRFGPWLSRIVTNLALNYRRSRGGSPTEAWDEMTEAAASLDATPCGTTAGDFGPGGEAVAAELRKSARVAIEALPEKQRVALVLSSIEGVPQKEIAEILGCSVELVKWNVFQARKTLKNSLSRFLPAE
jgi:RNA polymerase sigma-70 factor (ECF subfamily)